MALKVEEALHMVGGVGETSYANNSRLQEKAIFRTKSLLKNAIEEMYRKLLPERLVVVDLGCSSGPNTFLVVSQVLGIIGELSRRLEEKQPPEVQFFLNDLPGNDFNTVFRSVEKFERKVEEEKGDGGLLVPHYIVGVPGSFYGRLFPSRSVHFFHSSYSVMWLSQVPQGIEDLNKGNIYFTAASPPQVEKAYQAQFRRDFSAFLKMRYLELSAGGGMLLTLMGRNEKHELGHGELSFMYGLIAEALNSMVSEGMISQDKVDSFNLPIYGPSMEEVKSIINSEGLFGLEESLIFKSNWDPFHDGLTSKNPQNAKNVVDYMRAVWEPLIAHQFGSDVLHDLFSRFENNVSRHLVRGKAMFTILVIVLTRRA